MDAFSIPSNTPAVQAKSSAGPLLAEKPRGISAEPVSVAFTLFEASSTLTKSYGVGADLKPVAERIRMPARAEARRLELCGTPAKVLERFGETLTGLSQNMAVVLAPPLQSRGSVQIAARKNLGDHPGALARCAETFPAPEGAAIVGFDFDIKAWPPDLRTRVANHPDQITGVLRSVHPAFGQAVALRRASVSSGVSVKGGTPFDLNAGQHRYFIVGSVADLGAFVQLLDERLILAGWGYPFITKAGTVLFRSLIDASATKDLSRLWFEADPRLEDPRLCRDPHVREPRLIQGSGGVLDLSGLDPLTEAESERLAAIKRDLQRSVAEDAGRVREEWKRQHKAKLIANGTRSDIAEKSVEGAVEKHVLDEDFEILLDDHGWVSVREILDDPERFHGATCADPLEPDYHGGTNIAIVYSNSDAPNVFSHAHGGISYRLAESDGRIASRWFDADASTAAALDGSPPALDGWPDPVDLFGNADTGDLGALPEGALPPVIAAWARSEARRKGTSPAFAAAAAIGAVSAAIGCSLRIQHRRFDTGWTEPAALWLALVAPPGRAKSPVISAAIAPLIRVDRDFFGEDSGRHAQWAALAKRRSGKRGGPDAADPGPEPRIRRLVVDDVTIEQQIRIHAANPRGILRAPDELVGFLASFGAYKKTSEGDRTQALRFFDGEAVTVDRVGSGSIRADSALMAVVAGTQPEKIGRLTKDLGADGMLQRFLFVCDDGLARKAIDEAPDAIAGSRYGRLLRNLATAQYHLPGPVRLCTAAQKTFDAAAEAITRLGDVIGMPLAWRDHVQKWGKFLPRLVLTMHAALQPEDGCGIDPAGEVGIEAVEHAVQFARFLLRHGMHFYRRHLGPDPVYAESMAFAGYLLTQPQLSRITQRTIYDSRHHLRGDENRKLRLGIAGELENAGWLKVDGRDGNGPSAWAVNPQIHQRFEQYAEQEAERRRIQRDAIREASKASKWVAEDKTSDLTSNSGAFA